MSEKLKKVILSLAFIFFIYTFLLAIELIAMSFNLASGGSMAALLHRVGNPFTGLFIGILATSLAQSSSSTTSLAVGLVCAGVIDFQLGVYIIMGANIGTSITNSLVALPHVSRKTEFEPAFAAAVVHDFFNVLTVVAIFPLEYFFGYLSRLSVFFTGLLEQSGGLKFASPLKAAIKPVSALVEQLFARNFVLISLFSIVLLFVSLRYIVKTLKLLVLDRIREVFGTIFFKNYFRAFLSGMTLTTMVQSSSVTTSLAVPFAAARILSLHQIFPYTLGANIGTTVTALLAALSLGELVGMQIALAHLFFNLTGIIIFSPLRGLPILMAKTMARLSTRNRLIPFFWMLIQFFLIPIIIIYLWG